MTDKWETLVKINNTNYINISPGDLKGKITERVADLCAYAKREGKKISKQEAVEDVLKGVEISAIRKDDKHGHESYGWDDVETKVIILQDFGDYYSLTEALPILKRCLAAADAVRDAMNVYKW